jgi:hypothetical protein
VVAVSFSFMVFVSNFSVDFFYHLYCESLAYLPLDVFLDIYFFCYFKRHLKTIITLLLGYSAVIQKNYFYILIW